MLAADMDSVALAARAVPPSDGSSVWTRQANLNVFQRIALRFLKLGPLPKHIGFIMDGNRRYAKRANLPTINGHSQGFEKLIDCYVVGRMFGVREITMYALSIENLKRSQEELDDLWALMELKLKRFKEEMAQFRKANAALRIIGNITLIPEHLQKIVRELIEEMDKIEEPQFICYLAIAYTSRDEMVGAMRKTLSTVLAGDEVDAMGSGDSGGGAGLGLEQIDEQMVDRHLYQHIAPVDLIIRTSGETRLSDFLLWQSSDALIYFTDTLWPEFSFWDLFKAICQYQKFNYQK